MECFLCLSKRFLSQTRPTFNSLVPAAIDQLVYMLDKYFAVYGEPRGGKGTEQKVGKRKTDTAGLYLSQPMQYFSHFIACMKCLRRRKRQKRQAERQREKEREGKRNSDEERKGERREEVQLKRNQNNNSYDNNENLLCKIEYS